MQIRLTTKDDYPVLSDWWNQHGWTPPPLHSLPNNGDESGAIVSIDGVDVCAGFIYETNSSIAWMEYIISNKEYTGRDKGEAINKLIEFLTLFAKEKGFSIIYTSTNHRGLSSRYSKAGFITGSEGCVEMIKIWR